MDEKNRNENMKQNRYVNENDKHQKRNNKKL